MRSVLASLTTAALLAVPAGGAAGQLDDPTAGSSGCESPLAEPGDYEAFDDFEGAGQKYWTVVPSDYAELAPLPLVIWLSSGGGDADSNYAGWRPYLDATDTLFVVVGTMEPEQKRPETLLALVDQVADDYCVDPQRIHAMGESSSAATVGRLACAAPDRIASFLSGMGAFYPTDCPGDQPVALMAITGLPDKASVVRSVEGWAKRNGCGPEPVIDELGSGVSRGAYRDCEADVVLYDIADAGHSFVFHECIGPGAVLCTANEDLDQLVEALHFFEAHPLATTE